MPSTSFDRVAASVTGGQPSDVDLWGTPLPVVAAAPEDPTGHAPPRRAGSIRRTMSIDVTWPSDDPSKGAFDGRARDVLTLASGARPHPIAEDAITGRYLDRRQIGDVASTPPRAALSALAGQHIGADYRGAVARAMEAEGESTASPLHLLLDDLAGSSIVSTWAWMLWHPDLAVDTLISSRTKDTLAGMEGVCIGFRPGSSALDKANTADTSHMVAVRSLVDPSDPEGWHALPDHGERASFRRARLIDLWREEDRIRIWSLFQDSAARRGQRERDAVHEYRLSASADAATGELLALDVTPGTLPHKECPAALANLLVLIGTPMAELRRTVLLHLKRTAGCTHLNDMLRALAEVPALAARLP